MSATLPEPAQLLYEIEQIKQTKARYFVPFRQTCLTAPNERDSPTPASVPRRGVFR
jgi:hypothetical protein